jgi:3',5'-cyclic-AMP phosphodiesterase
MGYGFPVRFQELAAFITDIVGILCAIRMPLDATDPQNFRLAIIADLHAGFMPDARLRWDQFLTFARDNRVDGIIQLGDFATIVPENRYFWESAAQVGCPMFHVIGNHDADESQSWGEIVDAWKMPSRYYHRRWLGWNLVILDTNDQSGEPMVGYRGFIGEEQVAWLRQTLQDVTGPVLLFCHDSLLHPRGVKNQEEIRSLIEGSTDECGQKKVVACFHGHWHMNWHRDQGDVPYLHINSASYFWMGQKHAAPSFPNAQRQAEPLLDCIAPYAEPLFTLLEWNAARSELRLWPAQSSWASISPLESGYLSPRVYDSSWIDPSISSWIKVVKRPPQNSVSLPVRI